MELNSWTLIFLMIFMLHNLEEIITVKKWMKNTYPVIRPKLPATVQKEIDKEKNITSSQFALVVFILSVFVSVFLFVAIVTEQSGWFLGVFLLFGINIFSHPLQSLFLRCYTPGVLTSLFLVVPYYVACIVHFHGTNLFSMDSFVLALFVLIVLIPVFLFGHKIAKKWT